MQSWMVRTSQVITFLGMLGGALLQEPISELLNLLILNLPSYEFPAIPTSNHGDTNYQLPDSTQTVSVQYTDTRDSSYTNIYIELQIHTIAV